MLYDAGQGHACLASRLDSEGLLGCLRTIAQSCVTMSSMAKQSSSPKPNPKREVAAGAPMVKGVVWGGVKPTAAFTAPGQKAIGLAKGGPSIPSMSGKGNKGAFTGTGASVAQSLARSEPTKPSNIVGALLAVTALPGKGQIAKAISNKVGKITAESSLATYRGLGKSGMGGKLKMSETVTGKQLTSSAVGSEAQQSARMGNLLMGAYKQSGRAGRMATVTTGRALAKVGQTVRNVEVAGAAAVVAKKTAPKNNSKTNKR